MVRRRLQEDPPELASVLVEPTSGEYEKRVCDWEWKRVFFLELGAVASAEASESGPLRPASYRGS